MADDDDDWVGEPPEGRISRDRAKPGFWADQWQARVAAGILGVLIVVVIVIIIVAS